MIADKSQKVKSRHYTGDVGFLICLKSKYKKTDTNPDYNCQDTKKYWGVKSVTTRPSEPRTKLRNY